MDNLKELIRENELKLKSNMLSNDDTIKTINVLTNLYKIKNEKTSILHERISRYIEVGGVIALGALNVAMVSHWYKKGFEFEEHGTISSKTFRDVISRGNRK